MSAPTESLLGVSQGIDEHIQGTIAGRAAAILEEIAVKLGEDYSSDQHSTDSEVWHEWEARIVEPLKPVSADGVNLPITFQEKGEEISAGVALTMVLSSGRREIVGTTRGARNDTRGMSRHNNHAGGIVIGEAHGQITKVAQTLGFTIGSREIEEPGKYWPLPFKAKRTVPFVNAQELQDFAEERLRSLWVGSQVVGVVFDITDRVWGHNTLAKSIVRDPDEPLKGFPEDEQGLIGQLNPYLRMTQRGIESALAIDDETVIAHARDRTGRQYLENALVIAARKEQRAIQSMHRLRERILESVTSSKGFKEKVAQAQAL